MKENELRLGNLFSYEQTTHVVTAISNTNSKYADSKWLKGDGIEYYRHDIDEMKPIPLTEEWLLKFGFKKYNRVWYLKDPELDLKIFPFSIWEDLSYNTGELTPPLDFVHQLQNLFFALVGEELTLAE